jgi:serine/threonine protein kinase
MNKYELIRVIGDGTYGIVYEGKNKETKEKVAIKKLKQKYRTLEECKNKIEITILEKLYHDNIIHLKDVIRDFNGEISYIFEYCDCNLLEFIDTHKEKNKKIPEQIIREIILQITKGLKYLHSKNYFHRDLKPENILLILNKYDLNNLSNNINESGIKVKIADFGTAKKIPNKDALTITEYVCTRWYRSPECVLRTDYYDETSDIWALGCIMAELYKLGPIFPGENEFDQINQIFKILGTPTKCKWPWGYNQAENLGIKFPVYYKKDLKGILGYIGQDGINLLNEIFQFDSTKRPSCNKILNHPYFRLIPKPSKNIIPYGVRNSFPLNIKTEIYDSYYINFIKHKNQRKAKNEINAKNNYITYSFYIDKTNSNHKKISDNMIFNQNLGHKNSDIKVKLLNL